MQTWKTLAAAAAPLVVWTWAWGAPAGGCVDVEVNGVRAPTYDCLTQRLAPAPAARPGPPGVLASESIATQPSNALGLYNRSATSTRMGNTFGTGVLPQRPATQAGANPVVPAPGPR